MSELPEGMDPEMFEDLHMSLAGLSLCHVIHRPSELWEILQLVKGPDGFTPDAHSALGPVPGRPGF